MKKAKKNYIIAGDFNAISPQDSYNKKKMLRGFNSLPWTDTETSKWIVEDLLKVEEIKGVLSNGLIDTYKQVKNEQFYTLPTKLNGSNTNSSLRVDYIFCSKNLKVKNSGIIKTSDTEKASDHYPIYSILEI